METADLFQALREKQWVDLSHPIHSDIPRFSAFNASSEATLFTIEADGFYAKEYHFATQYGTHIDAPIHFAQGKRYLSDLSLKELSLPLYVIHKEKEVAKNPDYQITIQDIYDFEAEYGALPSESFVAFASGWHKRFNQPAAFYNHDEAGLAHVPGWSMAALQYLAEVRNVTAIGHETLDTDAASDFQKNNGLLGELYWLSQDKYQVEVLANLDQVPSVGSIIMINFPNFLHAPGFPVRAVAILP